MSMTLVKPQKTAAELAEMIRRSLGKPDLRVAIFGTTRGWRARVYSEAGENVARLQVLAEQKAECEQYDMIQ